MQRAFIRLISPGPVVPPRPARHGSPAQSPLVPRDPRTVYPGTPWSSPGKYRSTGSRRHEPLTDRVTDQARRLVNPELRHDPAAMRLGGLGADAERAGDLLRRLSL